MRVHSQRSHQTDIINIVMKATLPVLTRVSVGSGALDAIPNMLAQCESGKQVLLLTQPPLISLWAEPLSELITAFGYATELMVLPDGENCKRPEVLFEVWQKLQELQFTRQDTIVALGGGALTDLAGFAASTYLRGVKLILAPTTLLAQVDASIGGKTGINLPSGKNLAGAFYFPAGVAVDSRVLSSLTQREIKSGLGEIIKYAFMEMTITANTDYRSGPRAFFALLQDVLAAGPFSTDDPSLDGIIAASVKMKLAVVAKDPHEGRLRRCLNLGHTLGHAVEKVAKYSLSHGECVAIGLVFAARLSMKRGLFDTEDFHKLLAMLENAGLPSEVPPDLPRDEIIRAMAFDKKKVGDHIKFVLPVKPLGVVDIDAQLTLDELKDAMP